MPPAVQPAARGALRRYDLALSLAGLGGDTTAAPGVAAHREAEAPPNDAVRDATPDAPPQRPPPGAPTVRPAARRAVRPTPALEGLLDDAAQSLMLVTGPDGSTAFDIAIRDDVFDELACRIELRDGRVSATFRVTDPNLRRLLEAELGRLRVALGERGLSVDEVRVASD